MDWRDGRSTTPSLTDQANNTQKYLCLPVAVASSDESREVLLSGIGCSERVGGKSHMRQDRCTSACFAHLLTQQQAANWPATIAFTSYQLLHPSGRRRFSRRSEKRRSWASTGTYLGRRVQVRRASDEAVSGRLAPLRRSSAVQLLFAPSGRKSGLRIRGAPTGHSMRIVH
jgi:hypothetical protein